ncbi:MAG: hypothetical protein HUK24_06510 [Sphaerochaetaceae bacterium]|nr:hypothetical protein [Sphaerochaetaceae bacterium]
MLQRGLSKCGYDWWWHSFTGHNAQTGEEKAFFIEFFLCNPSCGTSTPVFGQLPENKEKKIKPSYLMVKGGSWGEDASQLHRFFPWTEVNLHKKAPFNVEAQDCFVDEYSTRGTIVVQEQEAKDHPEYMCQSGTMSWNLKIDKKIAFNVGYGAGPLFRYLQLFNMFWHAQGMKSFYSGEVIWNGIKYIVTPENSYGYADKNWGKDFTSPWVWLSSNNLTSLVTGKKLNNSVFDIGGGCPKIGPLSFKRKLLSAYWYEGQPYEFNFSKFWTGTKTVFDCKETETQVIWHIEQKTWFNKMITDITCNKKDMLFVNYEAPDGQKRHNRLFNGGNGEGTISLYHKGKLVDTVMAKNIGCEYGEYC